MERQSDVTAVVAGTAGVDTSVAIARLRDQQLAFLRCFHAAFPRDHLAVSSPFQPRPAGLLDPTPHVDVRTWGDDGSAFSHDEHASPRSHLDELQDASAQLGDSRRHDDRTGWSDDTRLLGRWFRRRAIAGVVDCPVLHGLLASDTAGLLSPTTCLGTLQNRAM